MSISASFNAIAAIRVSSPEFEENPPDLTGLDADVQTLWMAVNNTKAIIAKMMRSELRAMIALPIEVVVESNYESDDQGGSFRVMDLSCTVRLDSDAIDAVADLTGFGHGEIEAAAATSTSISDVEHCEVFDTAVQKKVFAVALGVFGKTEFDRAKCLAATIDSDTLAFDDEEIEKAFRESLFVLHDRLTAIDQAEEYPDGTTLLVPA